MRADPVELDILVRAAARAADYQQKRDVALARTIVDELAKAMKRRGR